MMKLFVAVLAALAVTDVSAVLTKPAAVGYKSSKIEIGDGETGSFTVDVSDYQQYCNSLDSWTACYLEIDYTKYPAGEQSVTAMTNGNNDPVATLTNMGVGIESTTTFCQEIGRGTWPSTVTINSVGTCGGISSGCISSTDAALAGVRVIQGSNSLTTSGECPTTSKKYVPFHIDTAGSNTAKFVKDATSASFTYPTMKVDVASVTGDKLFLMLDITNTLETKYGVQFHITANQTCGMWQGSTASACEDPTLVPESAADYKVYPATDAMVTGQRGDFASSFINLDFGTWYVTPYVLETVDDSLGSNTIAFRYCAALGKECDSAFAAAPSMLFGAILAAVVAAIQRF